jgi:four helix bundle protein
MDSMKKELEARTKRFALAVIKFVATLPKSKAADVLGLQLLKSGTSIGANYREANRGSIAR